MEEKQIVEDGNKLIAVFDGATFYEEWQNEEYHSPNPHWYFKDGEYLSDKVQAELKYHSSWDWLMPVVEKIEKIGYNCNMQQIHSAHYCGFFSRKPDAPQTELGTTKATAFSPVQYDKSRIETVWLAVISFIKWYNSQTKAS